MQESINNVINALNGYLFSPWVVYALLAAGVLFTVWSVFGQYRALTHGVAVVRGKYDEKGDPGAINHFQALSAALSATVGLGNIGGVAVAVALGGPGAILWMWVIGIVGMALKMTEVTQSMLYRNTDDPENPHGGPMFVIKRGLEQGSRNFGIAAGVLFAVVVVGLTAASGNVLAIAIASVIGLGLIALGFTAKAALGAIVGGIFVVTLITSAITGGNMFQAWNVADVTFTYFEMPQVATGIILALIVGAVIIGGIKRIGAVAGRLVPVMCVLYLLAAIYVLVLYIDQIPAMLMLIVKSGLPEVLGGETALPTGAFLGGTFGYAAMWGIKRALFSSEAGQGSAPIAHAAAKTNEPVREGVVAGLEPFIDTIVVCTMTALVILATGAYNRPPEAAFESRDQVSVVFSSTAVGEIGEEPLADVMSPSQTLVDGDGKALQKNAAVFTYVTTPGSDEKVPLSGAAFFIDSDRQMIGWDASRFEEEGLQIDDLQPVDGVVYAGALPQWKLETIPLPEKTTEAKRILRVEEGLSGWREKQSVFMIVHADMDDNTGRDLRRLTGEVARTDDDQWVVKWTELESAKPPTLIDDPDGTKDLGIYGDYTAASLTAHAFDRATPGLGKWLIVLAAWLFAVSTMISWSYYGEQGIYYMCMRFGDSATNTIVLLYKLIYCALIVLTTVLAMSIFGPGGDQAIIGNETQLDMWTTLGLGVMLVANIPIMLLFGAQAMKAYHGYFKRFSSGEMEPPHGAPRFKDVVEGKDVK